MIRVHAISLVLFSLLTLRCVGQQTATDTQSAFCTFDDGKELKVEYSTLPAKHREEFHNGKIWEPGGSPMILFTQSAVTVGGTVVPEGAFSMYIIPEKENWTLIVNRNATAGSKYEESQDLVRAPMQVGQTDSPVKTVQVAFAHVAPKECNLRLYYETSGAWAEFLEK